MKTKSFYKHKNYTKTTQNYNKKLKKNYINAKEHRHSTLRPIHTNTYIQLEANTYMFLPTTLNERLTIYTLL